MQGILCMNKPEQKELMGTKDQSEKKLLTTQRNSP